jgi:predicted ATP-grasp superfamily ATP-dependent carboligase
MTARPPAVLLGMSETGLGALRLLGRAGVTCLGVDTIGRAPAYWSRYCHQGVVLPREATDDAILQALCELAARAPRPPVLLPTSDRYVHLISRERGRLWSCFQMLLPEHEVVEDLLDKHRFARRAEAIRADIPRGVSLRGLEELPSLVSQLALPLILKPIHQPRNRAARVPKVILVEQQEQVAAVQRRYADCAGVLFIAQEYIPGADAQHLSVAVCLDRQRDVVATFTARKQRQTNHGAGVGTYVESSHDPEAEASAIALLRNFGFVGLAEIEFKRHAQTGRLYVIDVNPRLWTQVALPGACGLNFPLLCYGLASGLSVPRPDRPLAWPQRSWQDLCDDFYETFRRGGYRATGDITCAQWFRQSVRARVGPYFAWCDPLPAAARFQRVARQLAQRSRG